MEIITTPSFYIPFLFSSSLPPSHHSSEVLSRKEAKGKVVEFNVIQRVQLPPFPTKCSHCGQVAQQGSRLLRCSKCKAVGYCNRLVSTHVPAVTNEYPHMYL